MFSEIQISPWSIPLLQDPRSKSLNESLRRNFLLPGNDRIGAGNVFAAHLTGNPDHFEH